ncbi:hypothetical protein PENTCL1PPCAC_24511, partial [Pristionchus entomophagus]
FQVPAKDMSTAGLCPICYEDMQGAATLPCGHIYDYECVLAWLQIQQTCPTCRSITSPSSIIKLYLPTAADIPATVRASRAAAAAAAATAEAADLNTNIGSLYVGNLHASVTNAMLTGKFSTCGEILSVHVQRDPATQTSYGYAYVNFKRKEDAERALAMNGYMLGPANGVQPMRVRKYEKDPLKRKSPNVYVKNLDRGVNSALLHETFSRLSCGTVQSCKIPLDGAGNNKGYGFVYFESEEACRKAIAAANGMTLAGKQLAVELNTKPAKAPVVTQAAARGGAAGTRGRGAGATGATGSRPTTTDYGTGNGTTNVYVKNLDKGVNSALLQETLARFGKITSCKVPVDASGNNKGFGFVYFETDAQCQRAVARANGMTLAGKQISVEINTKTQSAPVIQPQTRGGASGTSGRGAGTTGATGVAGSGTGTRGNYGPGARGTPGAGPANRGTRGQGTRGRGTGGGQGLQFTPDEMADIIRKMANIQTQ